jgi:DMSO/TMAO reductase YedYZ molybdopterin-dependent catalytic subunit
VSTALTRRSLLAAVFPAFAAGEELLPFADYTGEFRVEAQAANPRVKCFDLRELTSWATPAQKFFAFHQNGTMHVDASRWRLQIRGLVERPREFTLDALRSRDDLRTAASVMECSGNSPNPALMNGLVSNAEWTGVPLGALLKECGVRDEAREVVFFGADNTTEPKWSAGSREYTSPHGRSLFVQDALAPGALLALDMNGRPLTPEHGFPLRLIMPGWYGMAQIKWLTRIEVIDRRYEGQQMARNYHSLHRLSDGMWLDTAITRNRLKGVVTRVTRRGTRSRISGAAWGGQSPIRSVEVQIDGGTWAPAVLERGDSALSWLLWSLEWDNPAAGEHRVVARAINTAGEVQPTRDEWRRQFASNREDNSQWVRRVVVPR